MTHACCPGCRLRFAAGADVHDRCPDCEAELVPARASDLLGFRLADLAPPRDLAAAIAAAALPDPGDPR